METRNQGQPQSAQAQPSLPLYPNRRNSASDYPEGYNLNLRESTSSLSSGLVANPDHVPTLSVSHVTSSADLGQNLQNTLAELHALEAQVQTDASLSRDALQLYNSMFRRQSDVMSGLVEHALAIQTDNSDALTQVRANLASVSQVQTRTVSNLSSLTERVQEIDTYQARVRRLSAEARELVQNLATAEEERRQIIVDSFNQKMDQIKQLIRGFNNDLAPHLEQLTTNLQASLAGSNQIPDSTSVPTGLPAQDQLLVATGAASEQEQTASDPPAATPPSGVIASDYLTPDNPPSGGPVPGGDGDPWALRSPQFGFSYSRKFFKVLDRYEFGLKAGLNLIIDPSDHRVSVSPGYRIEGIIEVPFHRFSVPKPSGFGSSEHIEFKSGCFGAVSREWGTVHASFKQPLIDALPVPTFVKTDFHWFENALTKNAPEASFSHTTFQPNRVIAGIFKLYPWKQHIPFHLGERIGRGRADLFPLFFQTKLGIYNLEVGNERNRFYTFGLTLDKRDFDLNGLLPVPWFHLPENAGKTFISTSITGSYPGTLTTHYKTVFASNDNSQLLTDVLTKLDRIENRIDRVNTNQNQVTDSQFRVLDKLSGVDSTLKFLKKTNGTTLTALEKVQEDMKGGVTKHDLETCCSTLRGKMDQILDPKDSKDPDGSSSPFSDLEKVEQIGQTAFSMVSIASILPLAVVVIGGSLVGIVAVTVEFSIQQLKVDEAKRLSMVKAEVQKALSETEKESGLEEVQRIKVLLGSLEICRFYASGFRLFANLIAGSLILLNVALQKPLYDKRFLELAYETYGKKIIQLVTSRVPFFYEIPAIVVKGFHIVVIIVFPAILTTRFWFFLAKKLMYRNWVLSSDSTLYFGYSMALISSSWIVRHWLLTSSETDGTLVNLVFTSVKDGIRVSITVLAYPVSSIVTAVRKTLK